MGVNQKHQSIRLLHMYPAAGLFIYHQQTQVSVTLSELYFTNKHNKTLVIYFTSRKDLITLSAATDPFLVNTASHPMEHINVTAKSNTFHLSEKYL